MELQKQDQVFRNPSIFHTDPKTIDLDRMLINLYILLKYNGQRPISRKRPPVTKELLLNRLTNLPLAVRGFSEEPQIAGEWLKSDVADMVFRGVAGKESIVAPRPFHLDSYKLRNTNKIRDYNASDQIFSMLSFGDAEVLNKLKEFLGAGLSDVSALNSSYDDSSVRQLDLITLVIMRLVQGSDLVDQPSRDNKLSDIRPPLCMGQARLLCDDIKRLLAYQNIMPRHVLINYIKTMMGIHLALNAFRLFVELPAWVKNKQPLCDHPCPLNPAVRNNLHNCLSSPEFLVDMGDDANSRMAQLAGTNTAQHYARINHYIRATFAINMLLPYATSMGLLSLQLTSNPKNPPIREAIALLQNPPSSFDGYFQSKVNDLFNDKLADYEEKPEILAIKNMQLSPYEKYVELITCARSQFHRRYMTELLDSTGQKNSEEGMLLQGQGRNRPRRFHLGSRLLEILVQIAVLEATGPDSYRTRVIRINDFMDWLHERYGFIINGLDSPNYAKQAELADNEAFRHNIQALKDRLREIGFYTDLSDAYNAQTIQPRYKLN